MSPERAESGAVVLVVEDNDNSRDLLGQILEDAGYRILSAEGGVRALEIVAATVPDVAIIDIMMPGMDGRDLCRLLRRNPATEGVPVIFLSAIDSLAEKLKSFDVGGNDFVCKPFDEAELLKKVRDLLRLTRGERGSSA